LVLYQVFPRTKTAQQPLKAITIWWGANDACLPERTQSIPLTEYKQNLRDFITMLRSPESEHYSPDTTIFLISPPPICEPQLLAAAERYFGPGYGLDRSFERTQDFARAAKDVAQECKVAYVPAFEAIMHAAGHEFNTGLPKYLSDGLHLTPAGYQVI
jgi:lysophospholipase L1-like esterase